MRQVKFLIKEAKTNTNTVDNESISDELCSQLLNRCQDFIMAELYNRNIKSNVFRGTQEITISPGVDTYDLPADIYAVNSISSVSQAYENGTFRTLRQISEKDRGLKEGYFVARNSIIFSPKQNSLRVVGLSYTQKLPKVYISYGTVISVTPTTILLDEYSDLSSVDDFLCVVDSNGSIIVDSVSFTQSDEVLTVASTAGILAGMKVVPGKYSSTHSSLPDECESSLVFMLEKLIQARLSSSDIEIGTILSKDQVDQIGEMFSDNSGDSFMPPILEYTEWA
jgi:hypothetical protein